MGFSCGTYFGRAPRHRICTGNSFEKVLRMGNSVDQYPEKERSRTRDTPRSSCRGRGRDSCCRGASEDKSHLLRWEKILVHSFGRSPVYVYNVLNIPFNWLVTPQWVSGHACAIFAVLLLNLSLRSCSIGMDHRDFGTI